MFNLLSIYLLNFTEFMLTYELIFPKYPYVFFFLHNSHILNYHSFKCTGRHLVIKAGICFAFLKRNMAIDGPK